MAAAQQDHRADGQRTGHDGRGQALSAMKRRRMTSDITAEEKAGSRSGGSSPANSAFNRSSSPIWTSACSSRARPRVMSNAPEPAPAGSFPAVRHPIVAADAAIGCRGSA